MILGIDIGNHATKSSKEFICLSKVSEIGSIINSKPIKINGKALYFNEGNFDTEYRKINKKYIRELFLYAIANSTNEIVNKVVVGLPISQYKEDRDRLKEILLQSKDNELDGIHGRIIIKDVEVYPEGLGAIVGTEFEGILIDIGGRTTDVCEVINANGAKKFNNAFSILKGTLNLYSDFIKLLNSKGLDLRLDDAERILRNGLKIDGVAVDISGAMEVFKAYVNELVNSLQLEYSLQTQNIMLVGGGSQLLYKAIKNRIPAAMISSNPVFANAVGFKKVGEAIWN